MLDALGPEQALLLDKGMGKLSFLRELFFLSQNLYPGFSPNIALFHLRDNHVQVCTSGHAVLCIRHFTVFNCFVRACTCTCMHYLWYMQDLMVTYIYIHTYLKWQ